MSYDPSQVAFIDIETTGLDPDRHAVWEIAVIVDEVEHVWQQRIVPVLPFRYYGGPLTADQWAMFSGELVDEFVLDNFDLSARYNHEAALSRWDSMTYFERLVRGRHLVGACPWFDSQRLHRDFIAATGERQMPSALPDARWAKAIYEAIVGRPK